jgi:shikimate dehydrogenase
MKLFTIFGDPITHSRSPLMHNTVFTLHGISGCYTRTHLTDGKQLRNVFFAQCLNGANVTVPHKEVAFALCDEVRGIAQEIGAVNTLCREGDRLIGYNTDADGFIAAIQSFGFLSTALIIGAGGTAKALAIALRHKGITPTIVNRSSGRLDYFKRKGFETYTAQTLTPQSFNLIINTTSAGLSDQELPLPHSLLIPLLESAKGAVDVIYGKETPFLTMVKNASLPYKDGLDMLQEQGVLANALFIDHQLSHETIRNAIRQSFLY